MESPSYVVKVSAVSASSPSPCSHAGSGSDRPCLTFFTEYDIISRGVKMLQWLVSSFWLEQTLQTLQTLPKCSNYVVYTARSGFTHPSLIRAHFPVT